MTLATAHKQLREKYHAQFIQRQEALQQLCRRHNMTLLTLGTADDPLPALQRVLGVRR